MDKATMQFARAQADVIRKARQGGNAHAMLQLLASPEHAITRLGLGDHTPRGALADAMEEEGGHHSDERQLLRDPEQHVVVRDGMVLPGRISSEPFDQLRGDPDEHLRHILRASKAIGHHVGLNPETNEWDTAPPESLINILGNLHQAAERSIRNADPHFDREHGWWDQLPPLPPQTFGEIIGSLEEPDHLHPTHDYITALHNARRGGVEGFLRFNPVSNRWGLLNPPHEADEEIMEMLEQAKQIGRARNAVLRNGDQS